MTVWDDVFVSSFAVLLELLCISFFALGFPPLYYINVLIPVGVLFLLTGERFLFRLALLFGMAFLLEVFSFAPFGLWFFRIAMLLGSAFLWMEIFSRGVTSLSVFVVVYPLLELLLERLVLPVVGSDVLPFLGLFLGKLMSAVAGVFLLSLWMGWGDHHVE
ncbi:hypothetical protein [Candidatus Caldatribacterium saccharofermentans]|uniref:Uncharacterized protein n=1 Tax=Candidatus Caldatribacterium saccharofermentans TaxID=1454753 RepID=A0A7V4TWT2_9BACT